MPTRILRDYTDSLKFDGITAEAERLFTRLIMKADDFGRFHAEPRLVKAGCFPLEDSIRLNDLIRWLDELSRRQLILRYESQGRKFLALINWGQRLRNTKAKFPAKHGESEPWLPQVAAGCGNSPQVAADCGKLRPESESESESDTEASLDVEGETDKPAGKPPAAARESDEQWLERLSKEPTYEGIDVRREHGKASVWCEANRRKLTRRFFVNWLNRAERPMQGATNGDKRNTGTAFDAYNAQWKRDNTTPKADECGEGGDL